MEDQTTNNEPEAKDGKNTIIIILGVALAVALAGIAFLLFAYVLGDNNGPDPDEGGAVPPPVVTVIIATNTPPAPDATLVPPTPEPEDPTAVVTARAGVNVRTGPGFAYPVLGTEPPI